MKRPRHETSPSMSRRLCYRGGETSGHINIPLDLMVEILKKLPAKSLLRFRCVSKQWSSIISCRRDFIDSIVTRSLTQPQPHDTHLICHNYSDKRFLSSTYITGKESVSIPGSVHQYVRGLVYCWSLYSPVAVAVIYNPTTRQSLDLPEIQHLSLVNCFFGYDPLENQYKLLFVPSMDKSCHVFTLGDNQWRNIQCSVGPHHPRLSPVCIKGIIYYRASKKYKNDSTIFLVSFDVRSDKFGRVQAPKTQMDRKTDLINYQGKLGLMRREKSMEIWVLEVAKKTQEWCKIFSYEMEGFGHWRMSGVTSGGEIHFRSFFHSNEHLDVFYYDPKRNCMRYGDMEGTYPMEKRSKSSLVMLVVPDPVENTMSLTEEKKKQ